MLIIVGESSANIDDLDEFVGGGCGGVGDKCVEKGVLYSLDGDGWIGVINQNFEPEEILVGLDLLLADAIAKVVLLLIYLVVVGVLTIVL